MPRLDKLLARRAGLTRSHARALVRQGRVRVGEDTFKDPSAELPEGVVLSLDGRALGAPPALALLHKPAGVQSTVGDPWGRPSLAEAAAAPLALGLHPVGRLDADTEGLLLLSRDGALTQRLLHPRHGVEKVYEAEVEGLPGPELGARLAEGVATAEGVHVARLLSVEGARLRLSVTEGKHRMVRRMLANLGHPVVSLRRVAFGPLSLGELPPGAWRPATEAELAALGAAAGLTP